MKMLTALSMTQNLCPQVLTQLSLHRVVLAPAVYVLKVLSSTAAHFGQKGSQVQSAAFPALIVVNNHLKYSCIRIMIQISTKI